MIFDIFHLGVEFWSGSTINAYPIIGGIPYVVNSPNDITITALRELDDCLVKYSLT